MIWFTSDTHFGHANVLHFADRPFGDIAHMNRALINAINERVAPTDDLYIRCARDDELERMIRALR